MVFVKRWTLLEGGLNIEVINNWSYLSTIPFHHFTIESRCPSTAVEDSISCFGNVKDLWCDPTHILKVMTIPHFMVYVYVWEHQISVGFPEVDDTSSVRSCLPGKEILNFTWQSLSMWYIIMPCYVHQWRKCQISLGFPEVGDTSSVRSYSLGKETPHFTWQSLSIWHIKMPCNIEQWRKCQISLGFPKVYDTLSVRSYLPGKETPNFTGQSLSVWHALVI